MLEVARRAHRGVSQAEANVDRHVELERHHSPKASGHAAAVRLADLIVRYASGDPVPPDAIIAAAGQLGMQRETAVPLLYEEPWIARRRC